MKNCECMHVAPQTAPEINDIHVPTEIELQRRHRVMSCELVGHLGGGWGLYQDEAI